MNRFHGLGRYWGGPLGLRLGGVVVVLAVCLAIARPASAQVAPAATGGGFAVSAGATGSGFILQYGERKMLGVSGFVDADTRRGIGVEAEGRWLEFHQTDDVHAETYSIGPRYHMNFGKFQPYAKGLIGFGDFNFPYNLGKGSYLVISPGVGADYRLNGRLHWRAEFEYQLWPQFNWGAANNTPMTGLGVSTGVRVRIF